MQLSICFYETKKLEEIPVIPNLKKVLIIVLNDTFNTLPKKTISLDSDLTSYLPKKDHWDEE